MDTFALASLVINLVLLGFITVLYGKMTRQRSDQQQELRRIEESLREEFRRNRDEFRSLSSEGRKEQTQAFSTLTTAINQQLQFITRSTEDRMERMRSENTAMLEKMRQTVDEKLSKTLEERLGQSFKLVSDRLEMVHKGLGEMQDLANGVGDLKKVLTNVKTRGIFGEIQLGALLDQILVSSQYEKNVAVKPNSRDVVEFAVKIPGKETDSSLWLAIDSKFPMDVYHNLLAAYESGGAQDLQEASKMLSKSITLNAKTIAEKYIAPPHTADFAIMFLPTEGLFAEVVRNSDLVEDVYRNYKVVITGPTTIAAMLNSFQLGFRTIAIEKRSNEVWKLLAAVKTEFQKFGTVLDKAKSKLNQASDELDSLVGVRTRAIQQKLSNVEQLPSNDASKMIE